MIGEYGPECDMWSIGVIAYIILVVYPHFHSSKVPKILDKIVHSPAKYDPKIWNKLSAEWKEFVDKFKKDPATRMKPAEALIHKWIKQSIDVDH